MALVEFSKLFISVLLVKIHPSDAKIFDFFCHNSPKKFAGKSKIYDYIFLNNFKA